MSNLVISCKESRIESNRSFYGCFNLGPFESGQSLTVANALRRTLLSECSGLAIISVLIENVHHEYSTLPGVRDSVLDILLNLKEIVVKKKSNMNKMYKKKSINSLYENVGESYFKPVIGYLKVRGPGVVRAKDLHLPSAVQLVDPEQYIATLGDDGALNMKFIIMEGKNYILAKTILEDELLKKRESVLNSLKEFLTIADDQSDSKTAASGTKKSSNVLAQGTFVKNGTQLFLDAIFNPVTKVNYIIEINENKLVENSNKKYSIAEDLSALINSKDELKSVFPFLLQSGKSTADDFKPLNKDFTGGLLEAKPSKSKKTSLRPQGAVPSAGAAQESKTTGIAESTPKSADQTKELIEYIENVTSSGTNDLMIFNSCFHPLKKENVTHSINLEIWTNGSLHPRDALYTAFNTLSNVFLNLQKTKTINPILKDWSSYKVLLNEFTTDSLYKSSQRFLTKTNEYNISSNTKLPSLNENVDKNPNLKYQNLDISTLNVSLRTYTKLKRQSIHQVSDLSAKWKDLSTQLDKKSLNEIVQSLKQIGINFD